MSSDHKSDNKKPKIGVLGTGDVGKTLSVGLKKHGYEVQMGTRDPKKEDLVKWSKGHGDITLSEASACAKWCDVLVLATKWDEKGSNMTEAALKGAGIDNLAGKTVIDATNPLSWPEGKMTLTHGHTTSGGEVVQGWLAKSHVVKCWNIIGHHHMIDPHFKDGKPDMMICGNDSGAKATVTDILNHTGWKDHVIDCGPITASRCLEPLCFLWVSYMFMNKMAVNHAFALLRHK